MSEERIHQARAALARAEQHWKVQVSCLSGGADGVIARAFGDTFLGDHISIGGLAPIGLHEVLCGHDDCAASLLAWYLATVSGPDAASPEVPKGIFWIRQRRALDQGGFYALSLPMAAMKPEPLMMAVDQQATALWTCEEVAKSGQVHAVILETTDYDLTTARRLQLACESGGARIIVLRPLARDGRIPTSSAWTRWQITPVNALSSPGPSTGRPTGNDHYLSLIGGRGVRPGSWKVKTDATTFSLSVADPLENRLSADIPKDRHAHA
ncbi:protein ImuA [Thalassospira sp. HF15]|uniref:ImuA family protein n=1 Tax=Thalassospira sp. HF15 TaxID=2722755 RepID=UPI00143111B7|nr:protein ImuA [Thalassospira sp. HF15]NIY77317.1 protein ImuA [Thalassospira sp. HF15]